MRGSRFGGSGLAGLEPIGDVRPQPRLAEPAHGLAQLDVLRCQRGVEVVQVFDPCRHGPCLHSAGHVAFHHDGELFAGDLLFAGSIGRTDLPGGDHATMLETLRHKVLTLPDDVVVLPGHGEQTSIGRERATNPFLLDL